MKREHLRPLVHAGALGFVFLEPVLGKWGMAGAASAAFLFNLLVLPRTAFGKSLRREGEPLWNGQVTYPLAVAIAYAVWDARIAAVSWVIMAIGDPAAALVGGSRPWRDRIPWNRRKSIAGMISFFVAACLAVGFFLNATVRFPSAHPHEFLPDAFPYVAVAALAGALVETIPLRIDDNLPIVVASALALALALALCA